jgi:hypothetical protein
VDSANQRVKGQFTNQNNQAPYALIAQSEDTLTVGNHNHIYFTMRAIPQNFAD